MRKLLLVIFFAPYLLAAQKHLQNIEETDAEWGDGSILLNDGTELKGLVRYNDRTGIVGYQAGAVSKSLQSRNITGFEFFDNGQSRQRFFYSLLYEDSRGVEGKVFFEVLRQYKDFAVISKMDPIDVNHRQASTNFNQYTGTTTTRREKITVTQIYTVYFLGPENKIEPYLRVIHKMVEKTTFDRDMHKNKVLDKSLLDRFLGGKKDAAEKFAKEENLAFDEEEGLLKILDHFEKEN